MTIIENRILFSLLVMGTLLSGCKNGTSGERQRESEGDWHVGKSETAGYLLEGEDRVELHLEPFVVEVGAFDDDFAAPDTILSGWTTFRKFWFFTSCKRICSNLAFSV